MFSWRATPGLIYSDLLSNRGWPPDGTCKIKVGRSLMIQRFSSLKALIFRKKDVFGPKDLSDLIKFEKIRKIRQQSEQKKTS